MQIICGGVDEKRCGRDMHLKIIEAESCHWLCTIRLCKVWIKFKIIVFLYSCYLICKFVGICQFWNAIISFIIQICCIVHYFTDLWPDSSLIIKYFIHLWIAVVLKISLYFFPGLYVSVLTVRWDNIIVNLYSSSSYSNIEALITK